MTEIIQETITTKENTRNDNVNVLSKNNATNFQTIEYLIYFFFGFLEILLSFRLVLKLLGASYSSDFVRFIYIITGIFVMPFEGIFRRGISQGIETSSVFEPSTFVAILVYAVVAWGIVKLIRISSGKRQES